MRMNFPSIFFKSEFKRVFIFLSIPVKRDIQENDEEAVQVKEQSILELGSLLAKTGQAAGKYYKCVVPTIPSEVTIFY